MSNNNHSKQNSLDISMILWILMALIIILLCSYRDTLSSYYPFSSSMSSVSSVSSVSAMGGGSSGNSETREFPHNPTHHVAPGTETYQSSYHDAQKVCQSQGREICSLQQLREAQKAGYGHCKCGWTLDGRGHKQVVAYPTSEEMWEKLQTDPVKKNYCGRPGLNICGEVSRQKGIWGHPGADIYCCDKTDFNVAFSRLDAPYVDAPNWINHLEHKFHGMYNHAIPVGTKFVAYGDKGYGISVLKKDNHMYDLVDHPHGQKTKSGIKALITPETQIGGWGRDRVSSQTGGADLRQTPQGKREAVFITELPQYGIPANREWSSSKEEDQMVRIGSKFQIKNHNLYLADTANTTITKKQDTAVGSPHGQQNWWIVDSKNQHDRQHGSLINNNAIIRLKHASTKKYLTASRGHENRYGLHVTLHKGAGNSDEWWKLELLNGSVLQKNSHFRLVHVNTGRVLAILPDRYRHSGNHSTKHRPARPHMTGSPTISAEHIVVARILRDSRSNLHFGEVIPAKPRDQRCENIKYQLSLLQHSTNEQDKSKLARLHRQYNKDCYKIPQKDYQERLEPYVKQRGSLSGELERQLAMYQKYHNDEMLLSRTVEEETHVLQEKQEELENLRGKQCQPVKACIDLPEGAVLPPHPDVEMSEDCQGLQTFLQKNPNGQITDELIQEITKTRTRNSHMGEHDIRDHADYPRLVSTQNIHPCYQ